MNTLIKSYYSLSSLSAVSSSGKTSVKHQIMTKMSLIDGSSEMNDDATNGKNALFFDKNVS